VDCYVVRIRSVSTENRIGIPGIHGFVRVCNIILRLLKRQNRSDETVEIGQNHRDCESQSDHLFFEQKKTEKMEVRVR
jgi:hypothetical protein